MLEHLAHHAFPGGNITGQPNHIFSRPGTQRKSAPYDQINAEDTTINRFVSKFHAMISFT
jgi:hypothetical protein